MPREYWTIDRDLSFTEAVLESGTHKKDFSSDNNAIVELRNRLRELTPGDQV